MTATDFRPAQDEGETRVNSGRPDQLLDDQSSSGNPRLLVVEGQTPSGHEVVEAQAENAAGTPVPSAVAMVDSSPQSRTQRLADIHLLLAAEALDDLERTRIANENRLRALRDDYGLTGTPEEQQAAGLVEALAALEHKAELNLKRAMRKHPLGPWVARTVGVGEKQAARLLATIGDPYWNTLHGRPRTVSELWAYSGLHVLPVGQHAHAAQHALADGNQTGDTDSHRGCDTPGTSAVGVAAKRRKGQKANWSAGAKMRTYLIAISCIKQERSPYRAEYVARRAHTAVTHPEWTPMHSHNDGLRIAGKEVLKDLWREARALHETGAA